jgi:hypothetical protein
MQQIHPVIYLLLTVTVNGMQQIHPVIYLLLTVTVNVMQQIHPVIYLLLTVTVNGMQQIIQWYIFYWQSLSMACSRYIQWYISYWQSLLMARRRYIQWYISYWQSLSIACSRYIQWYISYWQSLSMACRRYIQWYISYIQFQSDLFYVWLLKNEVSTRISHSDAPQSVGFLWTSDHLVAKNSTWQHITLTTERHPCPRWDSNPPSQEASGLRPTPQTAIPLGQATLRITQLLQIMFGPSTSIKSCLTTCVSSTLYNWQSKAVQNFKLHAWCGPSVTSPSIFHALRLPPFLSSSTFCTSRSEVYVLQSSR